MKKFTIITKDGSKWLRPTDMYDERHIKDFALPYQGNHPEGTVLSEEEVSLICQMGFDGGSWTEITYDSYIDKGERFPVRIAYVDAESHDTHITDTIETEEQLAYKSLEEIHKHTTLCTNDDEENLFVVGFIYGLRQGKSHNRHVSDDYWRKRCEAAENLLNAEAEFEHNLITAEEYGVIREEWEQIVKQEQDEK